MLCVYCKAWIEGGALLPLSPSEGSGRKVKSGCYYTIISFLVGDQQNFIRMGQRSLFPLSITNTLTCCSCPKTQDSCFCILSSSLQLKEAIHSTGFSPSTPSPQSVCSRWQLIWLTVHPQYHGSYIDYSSHAQLLWDVLQINNSEFWNLPS